MHKIHICLFASVALIALALVPANVSAGSCCGAPAPAETKKCEVCPKCGGQDCKCPKTATTTNACAADASAKCEAPKPAATK